MYVSTWDIYLLDKIYTLHSIENTVHNLFRIELAQNGPTYSGQMVNLRSKHYKYSQ